MSIIRLIHITIDPSETANALQVWKKECAPLMISKRAAFRKSCSAVETRMNSFPIPNGQPKPTLRPTSTVRLTRRLCITRVV